MFCIHVHKWRTLGNFSPWHVWCLSMCALRDNYATGTVWACVCAYIYFAFGTYDVRVFVDAILPFFFFETGLIGRNVRETMFSCVGTVSCWTYSLVR